MKTKMKALTLALCAVLLVATTVFVTVAYLTSTTETVTNTFSVGNVKITLDEVKVDEYGVPDTTGARVMENTYKLIPGHSYTKDPTVHVDANSENCWLFVKVVNEISAIEAAVNDDFGTTAEQMESLGWTLVGTETNVYAYRGIVSAGTNVKVFDFFKIKGDITDLSAYNGKTITIQAYAVQADGFDTAAAAWAAAPSEWKADVAPAA